MGWAKRSGESYDTVFSRGTLAPTDRLAALEAELLNVHVDFPLFQRLALPDAVWRTTIPGIKIHDNTHDAHSALVEALAQEFEARTPA